MTGAVYQASDRRVRLEPRWIATSVLLHLALAGVMTLLLPAAEIPRPSLRVRLIEESKEPVPILAPTQAPVRPARAATAARRILQPRASAREEPVRAVVRDEPSVPQGVPDAREPVVVSPPSSAPGSAPESVEAGGALRPDPHEVKQGDGPGVHPGAAEAGSPAARAASEQPSGVFLIPSTGSGTGHSGLGNGAGSASGSSGLGAAGDGLGEGSGTGPGRGSGVVASLGGRGGSGSGNGSSVADHLGVIRRQIEQAKVYPDVARREGMQGIVELRFRIAGDGSVEAIEVVRSSGHRLLDEISAQTVRRAGPYPILAGWIRVPLSYRLDR